MAYPGPGRFQIFINTSDDENDEASPRDSEEWPSPLSTERGPLTPKGFSEHDLLDISRLRSETSQDFLLPPYIPPPQECTDYSAIPYGPVEKERMPSFQHAQTLLDGHFERATDSMISGLNVLSVQDSISEFRAKQKHVSPSRPEAFKGTNAVTPPSARIPKAAIKSESERLDDAVEELTRDILSNLEEDRGAKVGHIDQDPRNGMNDTGLPLERPENCTLYYQVSSNEPMAEPIKTFVPSGPGQQPLDTMYSALDGYDIGTDYVKRSSKQANSDLINWLQKNMESLSSETSDPGKMEIYESGGVTHFLPVDPAIIHTGPSHKIDPSSSDSTCTVQEDSRQSLPVFSISNVDTRSEAESVQHGDEMLSLAQEMAEEVPTVYVSPSGLLTVLLKHEVAVELTLDRSIRVVNHRHQSVVAANNRGNSSCIYHACAKIFQERTNTDVEVFWDRKAKFTTKGVRFSHGPSCYHVDKESRLLPALNEPGYFADQSKDVSVCLLYSDSSFGPQLVRECTETAKSANYVFHRDGSISVFIMGIRICQLVSGDVIVTCGPKQIRVSPVYGSLYLRTHFVEMAVEMNWNIKVRRGDHRLHASFTGFLLTDGIQEFGFDQYRQPFLQPHTLNWETIIEEDVIADADVQDAEALASGEFGPNSSRFPGMMPPMGSRHLSGKPRRFGSSTSYRDALLRPTRSMPQAGEYDRRRGRDKPRRRRRRSGSSKKHQGLQYYNSQHGSRSSRFDVYSSDSCSTAASSYAPSDSTSSYRRRNRVR